METATIATNTTNAPATDATIVALMELIQKQSAMLENVTERLAKIESATTQKTKKAVKSKLSPYRADFTLGVEKFVFQPLKDTDNKVVFALICKDVSVDKEGYQRHPVFSFTLRQFMAFMETYRNCVDGDLITLTDAKHNASRFYCTKGTEAKWIGE